MPVKSINPVVDGNRARYYRARANRIEREVAEMAKDLVEPKRIESDLRAFCEGIKAKIEQSKLTPELRKELGEDLDDYVRKLSLNSRNGKSNARARSTRQRTRK